MKSIILFITIVLCGFVLRGADDTLPGTFDEKIRSVQVRYDGDDFALPVVILGTSDRIRIDFDCIGEDRDYFRYSLVHCNADWQPSGLFDSEILDGFNEGTIEDYDFSRAVTVHYVHYSLTIPNEQVAPKVSGNYLLRIYREDDPETTVLQCRFMVSEASVPVDVDVRSRTDIDFNARHQQLYVAANIERAAVRDPFNDLIVVAEQNHRPDTRRILRHPLRMAGPMLYYEHAPELIFRGGNEYRRMEFLSDQLPGTGVENITFLHPYYYYNLRTDEGRAEDSYLYDKTQNGRFFIREYNSDDSDLEADYGVVMFNLDIPQIKGREIYIDGDLTSRRFDDNSRMVFNPASGMYQRAMLLKQGAYNYQYLVVDPSSGRGETAPIEGDKYQTVNEYTVLIYHRPPGSRYDRLVGVGEIVNR